MPVEFMAVLTFCGICLLGIAGYFVWAHFQGKAWSRGYDYGRSQARPVEPSLEYRLQQLVDGREVLKVSINEAVAEEHARGHDARVALVRLLNSQGGGAVK
ncbi:hypothetical protein [Microbacterium sp. NPDC076895]|uniref:hypothetical protein n=1 Tax=Microbacterium sp. NPDC076895 TaxID=3154957 RepID=UPI003446EC77